MQRNDGRALVSPSTTSWTVIDVPDIRDYQRINSELAQLLDQGIQRLRLTGVEGQRLLLSRLHGPWEALIEIEGNPGPELASGLDAPGLMVVCHGSAADGAGSGLVGGHLLVRGDAGICAGVSQRGGSVVVAGEAAERSGLNQAGGSLVLLGHIRGYVGERQSGGILIIRDHVSHSRPGRGRRGGRILHLRDRLIDQDAKLVRETLSPFDPWLTPAT